MSGSLNDRVHAALVVTRAADGGFPTAPGGASEPEPTALAALALDDERARAWLRSSQATDGSWSIAFNPSATGLGALALGPDAAANKALDYLFANRAEVTKDDPHPNACPWSWAPHTYGWVDPTARALLAFRRLRPSATEPIESGVVTLADRECSNGGWNYGNRSVLDQSLEPYVHPSAVAMIALHGVDHPVVARGRKWLLDRWPFERGGLSLACTLVALRLLGESTADVTDALGTQFDRSGFLGDNVALAWALIGLGDGTEHLRVGSS